MKSIIDKNMFFFIIVFFPFSIIYSTDTDPGDFVVKNGTTTYENLPFIETFSGGSGSNFDKWVSAQVTHSAGNSFNFSSTTDDYDCVDGSCGNDDQYYSSFTPPDSFYLDGQSSVEVWKKNASAPNWSSAPVAIFRYSHTRDYSTAMYSPLINISEFSDIKISFDMYFDAWESTTTNEYLEVEYCTGSGWENALTFLADASLGAVDIPW